MNTTEKPRRARHILVALTAAAAVGLGVAAHPSGGSAAGAGPGDVTSAAKEWKRTAGNH